MKIADLYIRVSTDEQADKGYSQRSQEEVLRRYCEVNSIRIRKIIYEDHSAKTFNRPEWTKLLATLKKHRGQSDLVLFTKWDRFSRNAPDAYQMINRLRQLDIEPQAIEQPLDLSIPENKMMLAIYLTSGEVENDRRALNVFFGMRRARKEGRYMGAAPIGYLNKTAENGRKYIAPEDGQAEIMRWAFEAIAKCTYNTEQVWRMAVKKGLRTSKNNFWKAIRNPVYFGKIFIPKYKDEESHLVQGLHEPIISESLFYKVQDALDGRNRNLGTKVVSEEHLPLRGFLKCPKCDRTLTGSASKGRSNYYYYYHCYPSCGFRQKAEYVNREFLKEIKKYVPHPAIIELYKTVIRDVSQNQSYHLNNKRRLFLNQIEEQNTRISKSRDLLLSGSIEPSDYKLIKKEAEDKITVLEAQIASYSESARNIESMLEKAASAMSSLDVLYANGDVIQKREIIGSMFSEKWVFDGRRHRTGKVNEAISLMCQITNELREEKNGTSTDFKHLSQQVARRGFEPLTPGL